MDSSIQVPHLSVHDLDQVATPPYASAPHLYNVGNNPDVRGIYGRLVPGCDKGTNIHKHLCPSCQEPWYLHIICADFSIFYKPPLDK